METPQVTVWRVAAVQKVRANNPHAAIDSLVARFRQLRPDLVRFTYLSKTSPTIPHSPETNRFCLKCPQPNCSFRFPNTPPLKQEMLNKALPLFTNAFIRFATSSLKCQLFFI